MIKIAPPAALVLAFAALPASGERVLGATPACYDALWLEQVLAGMAAGGAGVESDFDRGKCLLLKRGLEVEVTGSYRGADRGERVELRFRGLDLFAAGAAVGSEI